MVVKYPVSGLYRVRSADLHNTYVILLSYIFNQDIHNSEDETAWN